eukprot:c15201_g1_i2 orf=199-774(-)
MDLSESEIECIIEPPLELNKQQGLMKEDIQASLRQREEDVSNRVSWKSSLFFWRRFKKRQNFSHSNKLHPSPDKPHELDHVCPNRSNSHACKKPKSRPIYSTTYSSSCDKESSCFPNLPNTYPCNNIMYGYNIDVAKIHYGPSSGSSTRISCDHALPPSVDKHSNIPYFQLSRSHGSSHTSRARLPLYIVS